MTTKVHFEQLAQPDRVKGIAQLLLRRNRLTPPVLILCPDEYSAEQLDALLWTIHPEAFLAHARHSDHNLESSDQPILISTEIVRDNHPEVLINAGLEVPPDVTGFRNIVDFSDEWDPSLKQMARERWRTYVSLGLPPTYLKKGKP
ncbi:MAG: DNA polymerase III subunit chi [Mariprofundales bacterium]|nr:DNA polymerase III subunit chi [Mariprofundales bacterium]